MSEYGWIDAGNGRQVYRRLIPHDDRARSDLPCPMLMIDSMEPTRSMADGQVYTSKSALRATYRASGNPQGKEYIEVGNEQKPREAKNGNVRRDPAKVKDTIAQAIAKVDRGEGAQV